MTLAKKPPPLVIIAGPTGSGKSALALALSRLTPATIINADASQLYKDLAIVTARPSAKDMAAAPHKLFGTIDGGTSCSAAQWASLAKAEIDEALKLGHLPVIVGGTGLYLRTLMEGIAPIPPIDPLIRARAREMSATEAYAHLQIEDPETAAKLNAGDTSRIARALEVKRSTGQSILHWQTNRVGGIAAGVALTAAVLLPERKQLFARCDARFRQFFEQGGQEEVRALVARRLSPALPVMRAIGVREISSYLAGEFSLEEAVQAGQIATRHYAKRQYTWFRNQPSADWMRFHAHLNDENENDLAIKLHHMSLTS